MKWFSFLFVLLCLAACSAESPDAAESASSVRLPETTEHETETSAAVSLPENVCVQAEVLTDHLVNFVMTPEWLEESPDISDEDIFRFLVSLSMYRNNPEHPYSSVNVLSEDERYYLIGLSDIQEIAHELFGEENWSAVSYTDELYDTDLPGYRIAAETGLWSSCFSAVNTSVHTEDSLVYVECDLVNSSRYEYEAAEYGRWVFVYEYLPSGQDGFLRFSGIREAEGQLSVLPEQSGEPIEPILLNAMNGSEAYDGDISTNGLFSAEWDLTAADGERLISCTGKPELYRLELFSDHVALTSSADPWDIFITDRTMSELTREAFDRYYTDGTISFNEFMRFGMTLKNGETIPLTVIGAEEGKGHFSESRYCFDRTITEDAVRFSMERFLPEGVEPEQYPKLYTHNREYILWEAADNRPELIDDVSMSVSFRRDSGEDFHITESAGSAEWFDAKLYNSSLYLTTDAELSGELFDILKSCSRTEWDSISQYESEVCRGILSDVLELTLSTQGRSYRERPWLLVQENADGTMTFVLENLMYETMVSGTLEIRLP